MEAALALFHPAVRTWFERRFPGGPTEPQAEGWPAIARGEDVLVAAPTGSGKTLAAFLVCIDRLLRRAEAAGGELPDATSVVYVSPLKALAADVGKNLEAPLAEIRAVARELGLELPALRVQLRSGDTPPAQRAAMLRRPPHIVVTTPESLFLLLTSERSRELLRDVETLVVDEIHAVAGDKRGVHLALSVERLAALSRHRLQRIGLSATQNPIEHTARLLVGAQEVPRLPAIVDLGRRRALDLAIEVPGSELGPVASHEQWDEILDRIAAHVEQHATTLVFVNTRRLAERLAHRLAERLGEERVAAHHGSLSRDRRLRVEERLRAGDLRALVATASLELGIDVGPVELVCQIGSPRSMATLLQRVGRSGHASGRTPRGGSSRRAATSSSSARPPCAGSAPGASTAWCLPRSRSTCWRSRSSRRALRRTGRRTSSTPSCAGPRPSPSSPARTSTRRSSSCPRGSRPDAARAAPTSTATA